MKNKSTKLMKHLSKSVLLEETGSPKLLKVILLFFMIIVAFFILWAYFLELNQVVTAEGVVLTLDDVAPIQHSDGGVIKNIHVQEGDEVQPGDVLIHLDDSELLFRIADEKSRLFNIEQSVENLRQELNTKKNLLDKNLLSSSVFNSFERIYNDTVGEKNASISQLKRLNELKDKLVIYAPIHGYIFGLEDHLQGTVVHKGQTVFEIVPYKRDLIAQLKVTPEDRGKISENIPVVLKFSSYDFTKYGGLEGIVNNISVTTYHDERGRPYYKSEVELPENYIGSEQTQLKIMPGMTLSAEIHIGTKSLLEYLIMPIKATQDLAFNEP